MAANRPKLAVENLAAIFPKNERLTNQPSEEKHSQFLDLMEKIFVIDPKKRISAESARNHAYFKRKRGN